jgi:hypothetical protein
VKFEYLQTDFVLSVPKADLLNKLQRVLVLPELLSVHFDSIVSVLHDHEIFLDNELLDPSEALLTV